MQFLQYHSGLDHKPNPECTAFNYDIFINLNKNYPLLYSCSLGGYVSPLWGGNISPPDWNDYISTLINDQPLKIIVPEYVVNNYYPDIKKLYETTIRDLGYYNDKLIIYIQKEQRFYYHAINDTPDWFYVDPLDYTNIVYHSIGYNVPTIDVDKERFKKFKFCKQGFLCESFGKLYELKDLTVDQIFEKRLKANLQYGKFIWYGNPRTNCVRELVFNSLENTKFQIQQIQYNKENLLDLFLNNNGIGISLDGLVYHTIRDSELSIYGVPNIKLTDADNYVIQHNNVDMYGTRYIRKIIGNTPELIYKDVKDAYDQYLDTHFKDINILHNQIRYQFFITLLQKFYNVEFFIYDILFGDNLKKFIDTLDMEADLSIFKECANPEYTEKNDIERMRIDYIKELHIKFITHFKTLYDDWVTLNTIND